MEVAAGVALLGYVLCPIGNSSHAQKSRSADAARFTASPCSLARSLISVLRVRVTGLLLVALVGFGPIFFRWAFSWLGHFSYSATLGGNLRHLNEILGEATDLCVLAYVLRRRGRSFSYIGLSWDTGAMALTLPLIIVGILIAWSQGPLIYWLGETFGHPDWRPPDIANLLFGRQVQIAAVPYELLNGFCEELIVRAYLMTVVTKVTGRIWPAVLASVAVQISYHFYQGVPLAFSHIPLFAVYSVFYAKTRSALPVALAHALSDLFSLCHYGFK
jgi:membrane protease YdiL (CAAX protease family)